MLNSLITGKDRTVTKEPCWDCCTNVPHGVRLMCGLYNKHHASDIAIYKTVFIQQPALEIKAIEHTGFFDPTAPLFCSQVTKLWSLVPTFYVIISILPRQQRLISFDQLDTHSLSYTHWNWLPSAFVAILKSWSVFYYLQCFSTCLSPSFILIQHALHAA